ncbi:MAG: xdhA [Phycisphaerales bacterium]|nr:xdhA [Phycisphaerales bacterium]
MRDHVLLHINGRPTTVAGDDAFLTLSDLLRKRQRLTGTKVVCAEGDCGSCAVLIGRPVPAGDCGPGGMRYAAVASCIQIAFQLDGAHVVTVEGLRDGRGLNPIQQSMAACHGAQCGFCTPGIVVSLYGLMHDGRPAGAAAVRRELAGNLCRCTGYEAIVKAAVTTDRAALKSLDALYPPGPLAADLTAAAAEEVRVAASNGRSVYKPTTAAAACRFRAEHSDCSVVAGATDLGVVYNKRTRPITVALSLNSVAEFRGVRRDGNALYVGSGATLSDLERAAAEHLPELGRFMAWFGSPLIKNAGTLGGNLVTGSPIGDTLPALTVLGAEIDVVGTAGTGRVPIGAFYAGYRKTVLRPDELVAGIRIPLPAAGEAVKLYKVSRRKDLDISTFGAAIWTRQTNGTLADVRIAYGGVGPMVLRMTRAEDALRGKAPTLARFEAAGELAAQDVTPITDVRGSEAYRRALARNILVKYWHETTGGGGGEDDHDGGGTGDGTGEGNGRGAVSNTDDATDSRRPVIAASVG